MKRRNVGIGTAIPAAKLEVQGDFRLSGSPSNYVNFTLPASSQTTNYVLPASTGTNGQFLQTDGTGTLSWAASSTSTDYLLVQEEAPNGATIGTQIIGFNKRLLNTTKKLVGNAISFDSVANTITLIQPGTYQIIASAPCWAPNSNQLLIRNVTTNAILISGTSQVTNGGTSISTAEGFITITSPTTFKLDHYMNAQGAADAFGQVGLPATGARGVFARCFVQKMATPTPSSSSAWSDYLLADERRPNGVSQSNATAGIFNKRELNKIQRLVGTAITFDSIANTISLNQVGVYYIKAEAICYRGGYNQLAIRSMSNINLLTGFSVYDSPTNGAATPESSIEGFITVTSPITFKLTHFVTSTGNNPDTFGLPANTSGLEGVFSRCFVQKVQ